jgi:hypothetical protein
MRPDRAAESCTKQVLYYDGPVGDRRPSFIQLTDSQQQLAGCWPIVNLAIGVARVQTRTNFPQLDRVSTIGLRRLPTRQQQKTKTSAPRLVDARAQQSSEENRVILCPPGHNSPSRVSCQGQGPRWSLKKE